MVEGFVWNEEGERTIINKSGPFFLDRKEKKQSCKDHQNHISQTSVQGFGSARYSLAEKQNEYNKKAIFSRTLSHGSSRGSLFFGSREWLAALKIQSIFRGFLIQARKALRALRGLVKIQALVRGFLVRKRVVATLHSIQSLMRAQTVVRSRRARRSLDKENARPKHIHGRKHVQSYDETRNVQHDKWLHNSGSSRFDPLKEMEVKQKRGAIGSPSASVSPQCDNNSANRLYGGRSYGVPRRGIRGNFVPPIKSNGNNTGNTTSRNAGNGDDSLEESTKKRQSQSVKILQTTGDQPLHLRCRGCKDGKRWHFGYPATKRTSPAVDSTLHKIHFAMIFVCVGCIVDLFG